MIQNTFTRHIKLLRLNSKPLKQYSLKNFGRRQPIAVALKNSVRLFLVTQNQWSRVHFVRGDKILQKYTRHHKIPGARRVTLKQIPY